MSNPPGWLGPATDLLRERSLDEAAEGLERLSTAEGRLERAIGVLENLVWADIASMVDPAILAAGERVAIISEHRGETPEATLARLGPARRPVGVSDWAPLELHGMVSDSLDLAMTMIARRGADMARSLRPYRIPPPTESGG